MEIKNNKKRKVNTITENFSASTPSQKPETQPQISGDIASQIVPNIQTNSFQQSPETLQPFAQQQSSIQSAQEPSYPNLTTPQIVTAQTIHNISHQFPQTNLQSTQNAPQSIQNTPQPIQNTPQSIQNAPQSTQNAPQPIRHIQVEQDAAPSTQFQIDVSKTTGVQIEIESEEDFQIVDEGPDSADE